MIGDALLAKAQGVGIAGSKRSSASYSERCLA